MEPEDRAQTRDAADRALQDQKAVHFEAQYPCFDESFRCFSWTVAPYPAEQLLYLFARDITDRRRNEREIRKLNSALEQRATQLQSTNAELEAEVAIRKRTEAALQESNTALEAFSYSVSHDLRAPIRAMQGFARILIEDYGNVLDKIRVECAERIVNSAERMDSLVHDLLIYSKLGHTELTLQPISLDEIVTECLVQLEMDLKTRSATVHVDGPLPVVKGHLTTLIQVFINLIGNGTKFVAKGTKPHIEIRGKTQGEFAVITLTDNGIGISPENQGRVFRVFERLHSGDDYPGTGLGLAIVRKGVERMRGQVGVESKPGEGSNFWVKLPLSKVKASL
jgi:signal transduction histidine kinase